MNRQSLPTWCRYLGVEDPDSKVRRCTLKQDARNDGIDARERLEKATGTPGGRPSLDCYWTTGGYTFTWDRAKDCSKKA